MLRRKGKRIAVNFVSPKRAQLKVPNTFQNSAVSVTYLLASRSRSSSSLQQQYDYKVHSVIKYNLLLQTHFHFITQWIPGHCQIAGNERADALAKKGAKFTQTHITETSYYSINL